MYEILSYWGLGMLIASPVIALAYLERKRREGEAGRKAAEQTEGAACRALYLEILCEVFQKARRKGLLKKGGYENSLYITALDEAIKRLNRGEDVDPEVASLIIDGLGFHLEEDEGVISVVEN